MLALWQGQFELILADWVGELAVSSLRDRKVVGFAPDNTASMSRCPTTPRSGRSTSSAATVDAA